MEYKKHGDLIYLRLDKGDETVNSILKVCEKENISSATYSGIGGCGDVTVATLIPENNNFIKHNKRGLLEMISLTGNITSDLDGKLHSHAHAMFSYFENNKLEFLGGHLQSAVISYTGEIVITPVQNGLISRKHDADLGIDIWKL